MTADRELERVVRSWLRTDAHESADRVLDIVLDRLDTTPQRRPWWPARRTSEMHGSTKFAIAAAAAILVAVIGVSMLPRNEGVGGGGVAMTPSPSVAASASPSPSSDPRTIVQGPLESGRRYIVPVSSFRQVPLSLVLPTDDWTLDGDWFHRRPVQPGMTEVSFYGGGQTSVPGIFTDACAHTGLRQFADSIAGQAAAVAALNGATLVDPPATATVGGRDARIVAVTIPADIGCRNDQYWLSHDPTCGVNIGCTEFPTWLGSTLRYWFVDLGDGKRFTIRAETFDTGASQADLDAAVQQLVDSVRFEP